MVGKDIFKIYLVVLNFRLFKRFLNGTNCSKENSFIINNENNCYSIGISKADAVRHSGEFVSEASNLLGKKTHKLLIEVLGSLPLFKLF